MGAYFSVRTARKSRPLPLIDAVWPPDPRPTLLSGKLAAKAFAALYEGESREAIARAFTTTILETYWTRIQEPTVYSFPLPQSFARSPDADLPETALSLART